MITDIVDRVARYLAIRSHNLTLVRLRHARESTLAGRKKSAFFARSRDVAAISRAVPAEPAVSDIEPVGARSDRGRSIAPAWIGAQ
jgi:hypothetical protein